MWSCLYRNSENCPSIYGGFGASLSSTGSVGEGMIVGDRMLPKKLDVDKFWIQDLVRVVRLLVCGGVCD